MQTPVTLNLRCDLAWRILSQFRYERFYALTEILSVLLIQVLITITSSIIVIISSSSSLGLSARFHFRFGSLSVLLEIILTITINRCIDIIFHSLIRRGVIWLQ